MSSEACYESSMGAYLRKHLLAVFGALSFLPVVWRVIRWVITLGGDADFVISRAEDPGWVAILLTILADPPGWVILPLMGLGFFLIYLDTRRNRKTVPSARAGDNSQKLAPISSACTYTRSKGQIRHNIYIHGGAISVGRKGSEFALRFSVASRDRINMLKGDTLRYLARIRGKSKGDTLSIQEFPDAHGWFAVAVGERFLGVNQAGQIIQGLILGVKDDRGDEHDEVIFKYRIIQSGREIIAI